MYKIISNNKVIDVVTVPKFVRFLPYDHIALTDKSAAHGIVGSDNKTIYSFITDTNHLVVTIEKIDTAELSRLKDLLSSGQEIHADETVLANAKRAKISDMSATCKSKITDGFTIKLSDDCFYNFRLTQEDQLNLIHIESQIAAGEINFVYHATNEPVRVYSRQDMSDIVKAFRKHVLYHTTYFNVIKQYIESLTDVEAIKTLNYGTDVSAAVKNPALRQILMDGGA